MIGALLLIFVFFGLNQIIFSVYQKKHSFFDKKKMNLLYFYHLFFYFFYYWYALNNPSDSKRYFEVISTHSGSWFELFGTDTAFIYFLGYPFYQVGLSTYEMLMFIFSWFGYMGFFYAYLFFRENIKLKIKVFKYFDFLTLILFLPNMHFWTASLGKGSAIFFGLMMFTYAISKPKNRLFLLVLSSIIIFHIRPHVFLFVGVGTAIGYLSGKEKISFGKKLLISSAMIVVLLFVQDKILAVANLENSENLVAGFEEFSENRSENLSDAGSGVNMASYSLPYKFFTFWFRPLFYDVRGLLGLIISFENLIYLLLFLKVMKKDFFRFLKKSPSLVKMSIVIFLSTSFAMTFVMSNLGIIMRQKSMVMYYIFFVIYYYLVQKKYNRIMRFRQLKKLRERRRNQKLVSV